MSPSRSSARPAWFCGVTFAVAVTLALTGCVPSSTPDNASDAGAGKPTSPSSQTSGPTPKPTPTFDRSALSIDDPTSLWVVVNKLRPLKPVDYVPELVAANVPHISAPLMRTDAAHALESMFAAAATDAAAGAGGGTMQVQNSYRSFTVQTNTHNSLLRSLGQAKTDAQSARPGYSEHQTGLAVDIAALPSKCDIQECFGSTPQGIWLAANAYRFGFILRYPSDKTPVTGYVYEPWHFRYVGLALAAEMHTKNIETLEEFFGLPAAPDYAP